MRSFAVLLVLSGCLFLGCHKKPAASDTAQPSPEAASGTAQQPQKPPPPPSQNIKAIADNAPSQGTAGQVDANLTGLLRRYVQKNGRMPRTFAEFASTSLDSPPPPPEGKKWVIDASDQTVKAVNK